MQTKQQTRPHLLLHVPTDCVPWPGYGCCIVLMVTVFIYPSPPLPVGLHGCLPLGSYQTVVGYTGHTVTFSRGCMLAATVMPTTVLSPAVGSTPFRLAQLMRSKTQLLCCVCFCAPGVLWAAGQACFLPLPVCSVVSVDRAAFAQRRRFYWIVPPNHTGVLTSLTHGAVVSLPRETGRLSSQPELLGRSGHTVRQGLLNTTRV